MPVMPLRRPFVRWVPLGVGGLLAGCSDGVAGGGAWGFVALALLAVGSLAYRLGLLRARMRLQGELRSAHALARRAAALNDACRWHTDAAHRLVSWQGADGVAGDATPLFADPALTERLQALQTFAALRLCMATPVAGSRAWELRGVPLSDAAGRFDGFAGTARPLDALEAMQTRAAALGPLLAAHRGPALMAEDCGQGWLVRQFNAPAAALWPGLAPGVALDGAAPSLPAAVRAACDGAASEAAAELEGWRVVAFGNLAGGARGVVLAQGVAAAEGGTAESDSFSFTVSHDLRAPIRVVEGFTRIVKEDYGRLLDRVGNDHLDRVLGAAARMNLMIDALLTLARLSTQPLARQPVNLSQLAGYVVDDLRRAAPDREAEIDIQPGMLTQGDPTLLRLVLENLLGNAWKYSARSARTQIGFGTVTHAGRLAYVVRDNGAGFDMRSADRLFGLFQRLHSASEFAGHGVGLASVRRIVRRHGGDIWAEAEPGKGAAFYFTLAG